MRRAARIDENQPAIVAALVMFGCSVQSLAAVGGGVSDLLVGFCDRNYLMEVKNPDKPAADQKLTPAQLKWHANWKGSIYIVRRAEEALAIVGAGEMTINDIIRKLARIQPQ